MQTLGRKNLGWDKIVLKTGTIGTCTDTGTGIVPVLSTILSLEVVWSV